MGLGSLAGWSWIMDGGSWIMGGESWILGYWVIGSWIIGWWPWIMGGGSWIVGWWVLDQGWRVLEYESMGLWLDGLDGLDSSD